MKAHWSSHRKLAPKADRTTPDGITHASKLQAKRWMELQLMQKAGLIEALQREVDMSLMLTDGTLVKTPTGRCMKVRVDHAYRENDKLVYEDAKGFMPPEQAVKYALFEAIYKTPIRLYTGRKARRK